ncbi:MAG: hypothetical protein EAZ14_01890 [Runella slithyformis]|nr:MAG: hypothetical protein EAZ14_01890 [Runella slithyformis]
MSGRGFVLLAKKRLHPPLRLKVRLILITKGLGGQFYQVFSLYQSLFWPKNSTIRGHLLFTLIKPIDY